MRRTSRHRTSDDLRDEYQFDYGRARPNRFAARMAGGSVAVVLDPDVATVFRTAASVNSLLRSVISAMPRSQKRRKAAKG